jgi:hypothetical protein
VTYPADYINGQERFLVFGFEFSALTLALNTLRTGLEPLAQNPNEPRTKTENQKPKTKNRKPKTNKLQFRSPQFCSPSLNRTNRGIAIFSPIFAIAACTVCPMVTLGSRIEG